MTNSAVSFFDVLTKIIQDAIVAIQANIALTAQVAQLTSDNKKLESQVALITSSLNADEEQKANEAAKLAALQVLVSQYQDAASSSAAISGTDNSANPITATDSSPTSATLRSR